MDRGTTEAAATKGRHHRCGEQDGADCLGADDAGRHVPPASGGGARHGVDHKWLVEKIDGKPIATGSHPSLNFDVGNQVNGDSSCNRYFGSYALTGEGLAISQIGSTMMMCEQPLMDQEALFQNILRDATGFQIGADGGLTLQAKDGRSIVARRKG